MSQRHKLLVLTANDLVEGEVVYFSAGGWRPYLHEAETFTNKEFAEQALAAVDQTLVVGAYLMDVFLEGECPVPTHFREDFRASGPSNYPHGKQYHVSI